MHLVMLINRKLAPEGRAVSKLRNSKGVYRLLDTKTNQETLLNLSEVRQLAKDLGILTEGRQVGPTPKP